MYIRKVMHSELVVPKWIGKIMDWNGLSPIYRGQHRYIFLKMDYSVIKLPFYVYFLIKYGECQDCEVR